MFKLTWNGKKILEKIEAGLDLSAKKTADEIAKRSKVMCPVGKWERNLPGPKKRTPGSLRKSIKAKKSKYSGYIITAGNKNVIYASYVELGLNTRRIPAKPFLRIPLEQNRKSYLRRIKYFISRL